MLLFLFLSIIFFIFNCLWIVYQQYNLHKPWNNYIIIVITSTIFVPFGTFIANMMILYYFWNISESDLKDTEFNRWLFGNRF